MIKEELEKVFNFLEKEMNKQGLFCFRLTDKNNITAFFKETKKPFAQFYVKSILKCVESEVTDDNYN